MRAAIHEEHAVPGTGECDREEPVFPPRAAVLFLDGAAVAAQARRAVADPGAEQPGLVGLPTRGLWPGQGPGDRRVTGCPGDERQGSWPRSLSALWRCGEGCGVEVEHGLAPEMAPGMIGCASGQPGKAERGRAVGRRGGAGSPCRDSPVDRVQASRQGPPCCRRPWIVIHRRPAWCRGRRRPCSGACVSSSAAAAGHRRRGCPGSRPRPGRGRQGCPGGPGCRPAVRG